MKNKKEKKPRRVLKNLTPLQKKKLNYMDRAEEKGYAFELSTEEFESFIGKQCTYCNELSTGIDRIDSSVGYVMNNCQPCCGICNMMKMRLSHEMFLFKIKTIYEKMNL